MAFLNEQGLQHLVDKINVRSSKTLPDNAPDGTIIIDPDEDTEIFNVSMDVDTALSATSTNPVQNKVIKEALDGKLSKTETAAAAIKDGAGNNIADTYAKKTDISGMVKSVNGKAPDADGNVNVEEYTHPNSGVTAGTYRSVTVNAQGHVTDASNPTLPISQGGTGATTASDALSNLGGVPTSDVANSANKIPRYNSSGHLVLPNGSEFWIA